MIPKIIHFCWLSNDEYPDSIKKYLKDWKDLLPEYTFVHWDTKKFDLESNIWVKQAFESKKYAFAADYIRLYAVYNYGGIYLDTDVEVLKKFDDLLHLPYFIGSEGEGALEAGVFGATPKTDWVGNCLKYYEGKTFFNSDGSLNMMTLPKIMMSQISKKYNIIELSTSDLQNKESFYETNTNLVMFPKEFFCAKNHGTGIIEKTKNTYSIHHFAMSWGSSNKVFLLNFKHWLMNLFGVKTINLIIKFLFLKKMKGLFTRN